MFMKSEIGLEKDEKNNFLKLKEQIESLWFKIQHDWRNPHMFNVLQENWLILIWKIVNYDQVDCIKFEFNVQANNIKWDSLKILDIIKNEYMVDNWNYNHSSWYIKWLKEKDIWLVNKKEQKNIKKVSIVIDEAHDFKWLSKEWEEELNKLVKKSRNIRWIK